MNSCKSKQTKSGQTLLLKWKPPICTLPFQEHTPATYHAHIVSLYEAVTKRAAKKKKPSTPFNLRFSKAGTLIIMVKRDPKELTFAEVKQLSDEKGIPLAEIEQYCSKKQIKIVEAISEIYPQKQVKRQADPAVPVAGSETGNSG